MVRLSAEGGGWVVAPGVMGRKQHRNLGAPLREARLRVAGRRVGRCHGMAPSLDDPRRREPTWPPPTTHPVSFPASWTHRPPPGLTAPFHPPHAGSRMIRTPRPDGRSVCRGSTGTCSRPAASGPSTHWTRSTGSRSTGCVGSGWRTTRRWPFTSSSGRRSPTAGPGAHRGLMRHPCRRSRPMPARCSDGTSAGCACRCCTSTVSWPCGTCTCCSSCTATPSRERRR